MAPPKLVQVPQRRAARIRLLLARLGAKQHVQNRDIEAVLPEQERAAFRHEIRQARGAKGSASLPFPYPEELNRYLALVDKGTAAYARAERAKGKASCERGHREAKTLFESALEALEEEFGLASSQTRAAMECWLDRPITRNEIGLIDYNLDPHAVPRKRGSRSRYAEPVAQLSVGHDAVRDVKERFLEAELRALAGGQPAHSPLQTMAALRKLTALVRQ